MDIGSHAAITARRHELAALPVREAITRRGKELSARDTVASARRLFENPSVEVVPVLDGKLYRGAVARETLRNVSSNTVVDTLAGDLLPTAAADTPIGEALIALDAAGLTRLVVLDTDGTTYVGLLCLRNDRQQLCVNAECHADIQPSS